MAAPKRVISPVTVTTVIEESQHEALKLIAYKKKTPMAKIVRMALEKLISEEPIINNRATVQR